MRRQISELPSIHLSYEDQRNNEAQELGALAFQLTNEPLAASLEDIAWRRLVFGQQDPDGKRLPVRVQKHRRGDIDVPEHVIRAVANFDQFGKIPYEDEGGPVYAHGCLEEAINTLRYRDIDWIKAEAKINAIEKILTQLYQENNSDANRLMHLAARRVGRSIARESLNWSRWYGGKEWGTDESSTVYSPLSFGVGSGRRLFISNTPQLLPRWAIRRDILAQEVGLRKRGKMIPIADLREQKITYVGGLFSTLPVAYQFAGLGLIGGYVVPSHGLEASALQAFSEETRRFGKTACTTTKEIDEAMAGTTTLIVADTAGIPGFNLEDLIQVAAQNLVASGRNGTAEPVLVLRESSGQYTRESRPRPLHRLIEVLLRAYGFVVDSRYLTDTGGFQFVARLPLEKLTQRSYGHRFYGAYGYSMDFRRQPGPATPVQKPVSKVPQQ
ncbi:MAG: hypothetical protein N2691_05915 [Patescibacteria group bacterium]|nr:hypothetical protein [Patescibacteria group bacterium]